MIPLFDSETGQQVSPLANPAPGCINAYKSWGAVQVQNDCDMDFRVKVIFAFARDSACKKVVAGTRTNIAFQPTAKIDGVVIC